jgi:hypothetical protein
LSAPTTRALAVTAGDAAEYRAMPAYSQDRLCHTWPAASPSGDAARDPRGGVLAFWANAVGQGHARDLSRVGVQTSSHFDPFFTTKEVGKGTGQGLAIATAIVDRHGGSLMLESGRVTSFAIRLPIG